MCDVVRRDDRSLPGLPYQDQAWGVGELGLDERGQVAPSNLTEPAGRW